MDNKKMKAYIFKIPGKMPCLNDYIEAMNRDRYRGNAMKQEWTQIAKMHCNKLWRKKLKNVHIEFIWVETRRNRDKDNISFAKKFILDGMVAGGVINNDGWKDIEGFTDSFVVDKKNPGVEVIIYCAEDGK